MTTTATSRRWRVVRYLWRERWTTLWFLTTIGRYWWQRELGPWLRAVLGRLQRPLPLTESLDFYQVLWGVRPWLAEAELARRGQALHWLLTHPEAQSTTWEAQSATWAEHYTAARIGGARVLNSIWHRLRWEGLTLIAAWAYYRLLRRHPRAASLTMVLVLRALYGRKPPGDALAAGLDDTTPEVQATYRDMTLD